MESFLRIALPIYFLCYIIFLVGVRSLSVKQKIGKSPVVLTAGDDIHGLISRYFKVIGALLAAYFVVFSFFPGLYHYFKPITCLQGEVMKIIGLIFLTFSFLLVFAAQIHMRNSFRIGIDLDTRTELVSNGLFRFSRNPIYVGMMGSLLGIFLVSPNAFTLLINIIAYILIQVQIRLEEDYLLKLHGNAFLTYKSNVRRFL